MGVIINAVVSPGKAGFIVALFWFDSAHNAWVPIRTRTTDAAGGVTFSYSFSTYPQTLRVHLSAGQVVDGVEYGEYTSEQVTLMNNQDAELYLYPAATEPPPDEPYAVIDDFTVPSSLPAGSAVNVSILLRNAGATGRLDYYIFGNPLNPSTFMFVGGGGASNVPSGASVWDEPDARLGLHPHR